MDQHRPNIGSIYAQQAPDMIQNRSVPFGPGKGLKRNTPFLAQHKLNSLQEPNMDQHRPNIGSIYGGGTEPLRWHSHVQHGNGGSHNATKCAIALLTTVTMRATRKSENTVCQKNFSLYSNPSVYHPINPSLTLSTGPCLHLTSSALAVIRL